MLTLEQFHPANHPIYETPIIRFDLRKLEKSIDSNK